MKEFNFSTLETAIINAMKVAYQNEYFNQDGGYMYFTLRNNVKNEIRFRLQDVVKRESLEKTVEDAMEVVDNMIEK